MYILNYIIDYKISAHTYKPPTVYTVLTHAYNVSNIHNYFIHINGKFKHMAMYMLCMVILITNLQGIQLLGLEYPAHNNDHLLQIEYMAC